MRADIAVHDGLSRVLTYPDEQYLAAVGALRQAFGPTEQKASADLAAFAARLDGLGVDALRELFTTTFDLNPVCTLDVGWHLYGETYDRGDFLVKARGLLRECDIDESAELPDHLAHLMRTLPRLDAERAHDLAATVLLPAVERMQVALAKRDSPFRHLLDAVRAVVAADAGVSNAKPGSAAVRPFRAPELTP
jgi:nitrate reductase delta subunit